MVVFKVRPLPSRSLSERKYNDPKQIVYSRKECVNDAELICKCYRCSSKGPVTSNPITTGVFLLWLVVNVIIHSNLPLLNEIKCRPAY